MTKTDHIFIVGLGRTGSTLTRTILNTSTEIGIGGESHFFRDLPRFGFQRQRSMQRKLRKIGDISTEAGVDKLVNYLYSPKKNHLTFWNFQKRSTSPEEFRQMLLESGRTERDLFELAMAVHAEGKPIRGEKTPAHIFCVPELLEWFPNAKVIHTFRDPRAIFSSREKKAARKKLPAFNTLIRKSGLLFDLLSSLHVILNWSRVSHLNKLYQTSFPDNFYLLKYEDLICEPRSTLQELCRFLGIDFNEDMMQQSVVNSSFVQKGEVVQGFDTTSIDRWREQIHPVLHRWFLFWCKNGLSQHGYSL